MARTAKQVVAMDYWDGRGTAYPADTREQFIRNMARYDLLEKVVMALPDSELLGQFDLVFIDGDHSFEAVMQDIAKAIEVLTPDGLIVFHDYKSKVDPGVTKAVDTFIGSGAELLSTTGTLAVCRPAGQLTEIRNA
jgi:hypothetical protein